MSTINTTNLNVNYPVPGVNNSSQGFRDNFNNIKTNLDIAKTELNDIQTKAVVKSALTGTTINNDMANTLISNALVRSFRASTYNLGTGVVDAQTINASKGDVHYGTIIGDTVISFAAWAPDTTQQKIELILTIDTVTNGVANPVITFPQSTVESGKPKGMDASFKSLENYIPDGTNTGINKISVPYGVTKLHYEISTTDCGTTLTINPVNRDRVANQITTRTPTAIGAQGDRPGTICSDGTYMYLCVGVYDGSTAIWKKISLSNI